MLRLHFFVLLQSELMLCVRIEGWGRKNVKINSINMCNSWFFKYFCT